jgi:hypothetical protein
LFPANSRTVRSQCSKQVGAEEKSRPIPIPVILFLFFFNMSGEMANEIKLISGRSHPELSEKIAKRYATF